MIETVKRDKEKFSIKTPLKTKISTTYNYWQYLVKIKHPHMRELEKDVIETLSNPDIIRQSKIDRNVYLFYHRVIYDKKQYYMCVVVNNTEGFLITAYVTDKVKEGELVWKK